jgi:hypothetical protein
VTKKNPSTNPSGLFHQFSHELQEGIVRVVMKDAPATRFCNNEDLALQAKARGVKEEMIKKRIWRRQRRSTLKECTTVKCTTQQLAGKET